MALRSSFKSVTEVTLAWEKPTCVWPCPIALATQPHSRPAPISTARAREKRGSAVRCCTSVESSQTDTPSKLQRGMMVEPYRRIPLLFIDVQWPSSPQARMRSNKGFVYSGDDHRNKGRAKSRHRLCLMAHVWRVYIEDSLSLARSWVHRLPDFTNPQIRSPFPPILSNLDLRRHVYRYRISPCFKATNRSRRRTETLFCV